MIREYEHGDELRMELNGFSPIDDAVEAFENTNVETITICDDATGRPKVIVGWLEVEQGVFATFLIMDSHVTISNIKEIKLLVDEAIRVAKPKILFTYSLENETLSRWHEFLGFRKSSANEHMMIDGKRFNKWVITWE